MNYYIGIDQSTTSTGLVFITDKGEYSHSYLIKPNPKLSIEERIIQTKLELFNLIQPLHDKIKGIGLESPAIYAKGRVIQLASLYGFIYYSLIELDLPTYTYTPSSIKKSATGNGRASKDEMIEIIPNSTLQDFQSKSKKIDDLADAYHIANKIYMENKPHKNGRV